MRVLFYTYPAPLSQGPDFTRGWTTILARLMHGLVAGAYADCHLVTAGRFAHLLEGRGEDFHFGLVAELQLLREAASLDSGGITLTEFSRRVRSCDLSAYPVQALLLRHVLKACRGFEPDLVITFGMPADYLRLVWPGMPILHVEVSAFSRNPYPPSLFFDHAGMYGTSTPALTEPDAFASSPASHRLVRDFRVHKTEALKRHDPFQAYDFRGRFERLVLMPLQVSNYFSYDEQCDYRTQFEALVDLMRAAPADTGVVVSEYVQWGRVLQDRGGASNLAWLRRSYPNLIFYEAFRNYDSVSQYLLPRVDGLFTVSSNLGQQAMLLGKRLVTGPRSHFRNLAHHTRLAEFFGALGGDRAPEGRDAFVAWYLERYAVPTALAEQGDWFADYLVRRLAAMGKSSRSMDGFVPVAAAAELRKHWLGDESVAAAGRYETTLAASHRALALADVHAAQLEVRSRVSPESPDDSAEGPADGYLLLNDTRALENHLHWGCNTVTGYIERRLAESGLRCLGRLNHAEDCRAALARADLNRVRLVILNGGDSLHHDNPRLLDLMRFCGWMKQRGVTCVLVNAVWFENSAVSAELLLAFDLVAVRESISLKAIRQWRKDARMVPDIVFADFARQHQTVIAHVVDSAELVVLDHVWLPQARALREFAEFHGQPFYLMGGQHVQALVAQQGNVYAACGGVFPRIMRGSSDLNARQGCVTGRYHGLIAALCAGIPALALASDTPKIQGLFEDMGVGSPFILDTEWIGLSHTAQRQQVEAKLQAWTPLMHQLRYDYLTVAACEIETLWNEIAEMTERPNLAPLGTANRLLHGEAVAAIDLGDEHHVFPGAIATPVIAIGFHPPESWGCWSAAEQSQLLLPMAERALREGCRIEIQMSLLAYDGVLGKAPVLGIVADDTEIGYVFLREGKHQQQQVKFEFTPKSRLCRIKFEFTDLIAPSELSASNDARRLGFGLQSLVVACWPISAAPSDGEHASGALRLWGIQQPGNVTTADEGNAA